MATRSLGTMTLDLVARIGGFERGMDQAERKARRTADQIKRDQERRAREVRQAWSRVGTAIGLAFTAAAVATVAAVKSQIDVADAASKAAQSVGLSTEAYTSLAYAANLSGVEQEQLALAFARLNTVIAENDDKLTSLGIATRDASGNVRAADDVLADIADRFASMQDGAQKSALAVELFGQRAGPRLIPLLNQGSRGIAELRAEAERLGIVIDTETGRAAEQFNDNLTRLKTAFDGLVVTLATRVLPTLVAVTNALIDNIKQAGILRGALITAFEGAFGETSPLAVAKRQLKEVEAGIKETEQALEVLSQRTSGQAARRAEAATNRLRELRQEAERLRSAIRQQEEDTRRLAPANAPRVPIVPPAARTPTATSGRDRISDADRYLESLRRQLQATRDLSVEQKLLEDIEAGRLGRVTAAQQEILAGVAREIDAQKRLQDQLAFEEQVYARVLAERERLVAQGQSVFDATRTPAERLNIELGRLNDLLKAGVIDWDTYSRAVFAAQDAFDAAAKGAQEAKEQFDDFAKNAAENIQRELGEGLYQIMQGNFRNIGDSFKQLIDRMVAEALAANLARKLFGELVQGGQGQGLFGDFLGRIGGFLFGGGRRLGGPVSPGKMYEVAEDGPELLSMGGRTYLMMGDKAGSVKPMNGSRQVNYSPTFVLQGTPTRQTQDQIAAAALRGAQRAFARQS